MIKKRIHPDLGQNKMKIVPQVRTLVAVTGRCIPECDTEERTRVFPPAELTGRTGN